MTKEAFKQHKDTLHWWSQSESRTVWVIGCSLIGDWQLDRNPNWYSDQIIVPNDRFANERKAGAEGKQLQVSYDDGLHWYDKLTHKINWSGCLVRVKPEPTFQVGDWVRHPDGHCYKFKEGSNKPDDILSHTLWQPQPGEMCVFWDDESRYTIAPFDNFGAGGMPSAKGMTSYYDNVAPVVFDLNIYKG